MTEHRPVHTRRRAVRGAAAAAAVAALLFGAAAPAAATPAGAAHPHGHSTERAGTEAGGTQVDGAASVRGGLEVIELEPYEALDIADDWQLGLLPEGRQNYVLSSPGQFEESVERAKQQIGDDIRPDSTSLHVGSEQGEVQLIAGAWRLAEAPMEITVYIEEGIGYTAQLVQLPGNPGWGTFHLDTSGIEGLKSFEVVAKDADGKVFSRHSYSPRGGVK
ncbi:hypothetical protein MTQ01_20630 [Streptomyces sp. XM4193]|uniref:hypothetical protein n=1 Tax=Streptomyces sp. XM4193 TaxID=2929782 RepID=UPI001FF7466B|nr:hypothetical protein [Streptomyces sp. XM4193]MCK1798388.1 hypothetical protein [Streptomyces sp. XM4193]